MEIRQLMEAVLKLPAAGSITPETLPTLLGLIVATSMRRTEATSLRLADATADRPQIRKTRLGKQRMIPL